MKDQYKDNFEESQKEYYHPASTKGTAAFLIGIAAALFGDTLLYFRFLPGALLCFVVLLICVVWIVKSRQTQDRKHYKEYRRINRAINETKSDIETIMTNLSLKADKPAKSNIRPGSKQSESYYKMLMEKEGFNANNRTENQETEER